MRRQARPAGGGARLVRTASALQVWLWLLIFVFQNECSASKSIQPGYLDFDNLPETNFTCEGKVIGGYYADLETSCQMFHVCTVGQQDEPMDIKFLCLNGTVFDQETRVCERVDEVDCTKSETFYSLNLELYGSTIAPPTIKTDQTKPQSNDEPHDATKAGEEEKDHQKDDSHKPDNKVGIHNEYQDSTEDPIQEISKTESTHKPHDYTSIQPMNPSNPGLSDHVEPVEENQEEEEIDSELPDYEDDYTQSPPTTTQPPSTTTSPTTTPSHQPTQQPHHTSSTAPTHSSISVPSNSPSPVQPTLDPALLSPQEFIYRHRGPGSEAISFQRQGFRPADGVYITHAPPQQFDHFQYESSRTAPRPPAPRPVPFVKRPPPAPFRATTLDPRDQMLRPGPSSQPSERHETSVNHHLRPYPSPLPAQRPLPFDPYYYEHKRSDELAAENESSLAARSVGPPAPVIAPRPLPKLKSPPRVIVTASASVSDSNGKRLNYTVGNVVSAVKPIVNINYDDYKESDLIFDPFFLDVPKLQKRRKSRGSRGKYHQKIFTVPATAAAIFDMRDEVRTTTSRVTSQATTTENRISPTTTTTSTTTTVAWNPNDYVDDNYEPHAYIPPMHPLAVLMPFDRSKVIKEKIYSDIVDKKPYHSKKPLIIRVEESTSSPAQSTSSQNAPAPPAPQASAAVHSLLVEALCSHKPSSDCRNRA